MGQGAEDEKSELNAYCVRELTASRRELHLSVRELFAFRQTLRNNLKWHMGQGAEYEKSDICLTASEQ